MTTALVPLHFRVSATGHGVRFDKYLAVALKELPPDNEWCHTTRTQLQGWIKAGQARIGNQPVLDVRHVLRVGDEIEVMPQPSAMQIAFQPQDIPLSILFEDEHLIVIDKPVGLVAHPAAGNWQGTLVNGLLHRNPAVAQLPRAGLVHRLDKLTSGVLIAAKSALAQQHLSAQLQARTMKRRYLALAWGTPAASGKVDAPIARHPSARTKMAVVANGKAALTFYQVLAQRPAPHPSWQGDQAIPACALLRCDLATGRTHQIRVHLEHSGFPLLGDPIYYGRMRALAHLLPRQALHAYELSVIHPLTQRVVRWRAPVAADFLALAQRLGLAQPLQHSLNQDLADMPWDATAAEADDDDPDSEWDGDVEVIYSE